jgi:hypothetical protein
MVGIKKFRLSILSDFIDKLNNRYYAKNKIDFMKKERTNPMKTIFQKSFFFLLILCGSFSTVWTVGDPGIASNGYDSSEQRCIRQHYGSTFY